MNTCYVPSINLSNEELFFFDHAGFSFDPKVETADEGYTRDAIRYAACEAVLMEAMKVAGVTVAWGRDNIAAADWFRERDAGYIPEDSPIPESFEFCAIQGPQLESMASLWGISDPSDSYRRVVRADLAWECLDELVKLIVAAR